MPEDQIYNKSIFAIGLIAAVLALNPLIGDLNHVIIFKDAKDGNLTLAGVLLIFVLFLSVSVYLYALNYIKYGYEKEARNNLFFKIIIWSANFFYSIAVGFPLLVFLMVITNSVGFIYALEKFRTEAIIFDIIGSAVLVGMSIYDATNTFKSENKKRIVGNSKVKRKIINNPSKRSGVIKKSK
jgi:hypothetical protein